MSSILESMVLDKATVFYQIPDNIDQKLVDFARDIEDYKSNKIDPVKFKAIRVLHGLYEQRTPHTYMLRIRCPGGAITPIQLERVADLGERYGNGEVHFTTRCEVQIHDLKIDDVIPTIHSLLAVGLSSYGGGGNTIRNILVSPYVGVDPEETFNVEPYAIELTNRLIQEQDSWNLPRKFKINFSSNDTDTAFTQATCLGFVPKVRNGVKGFRVVVGGGMGAKPMVGHVLLEFVAAEKTYQVARAIKELFDEHGNRKNKTTSRIKFLWEKLQRETFVNIFEEKYSQIVDKDELDLKIEEPGFDQLGEVETDSLDEALQKNFEKNSDYKIWFDRFAFKQKQRGYYTTKLPLRLGDLLAPDARILADFLKQLPNQKHLIRCDRGQNAFIRFIPQNKLYELYQLVKGMNQTLVEFPSFFSSMVNCTGAQTCKLGICLPRGLSDQIRNRVSVFPLDFERLKDFRLNMSGCPNTCGLHHIAHLGFFGKVGRKNGDLYPMYNVLAGGKVGDEGSKQGESDQRTQFAKKYGETSAHYIPELVGKFLTHYLECAENYIDYYDYLEQVGGNYLTQLCAEFQDIPDFEEDPKYYTDFGAKSRLSLKEIGTAECSASMFDMIGVERKRIKEIKNSLDLEDGTKNDPALLYQLLVSSARMLLVTRGLEGKTDQKNIELFAKHFIQTGLIADQKYLSLLKVKTDSEIIENQSLIVDLSEAVNQLYLSMNDSLRFATSPAVAK